MDMIVDRLSEIEQAAIRIVDSASIEKKEMEAESKKRIDAYDVQIDSETAIQLKVLKETLDSQMQQELAQLKEDTDKTLHMIEMDYNANHEQLADEILKKMIKR